MIKLRGQHLSWHPTQPYIGVRTLDDEGFNVHQTPLHGGLFLVGKRNESDVPPIARSLRCESNALNSAIHRPQLLWREEILLAFVSCNEFVDSSNSLVPIKPICHPDLGPPCLLLSSNSSEIREKGDEAMEINTWHPIRVHKNSDGGTLVLHFNKQLRPRGADGYGLHANDFSNSKGDGADKKFGFRFRQKERNELKVLKSLFGAKLILGSAYEKSGISGETNEPNTHINRKGKVHTSNIVEDSTSRKNSRNSITTKYYGKTPSLELYKSNLKYLKQDLLFNKHIVSNAGKYKVFSTIVPTTQKSKMTKSSVVKHRVKVNESSVLFIFAFFPFIVEKSPLNEQPFVAPNIFLADTKLGRTNISTDFRSKITNKRNRRFIDFNSYVSLMTCDKRCKVYNKASIKTENYFQSKFPYKHETPTSMINSNLKKSEPFNVFKKLYSANVAVPHNFINKYHKRNQIFERNKPLTYASDFAKNTNPIERSHQFKEHLKSRPISDNNETVVDDEDSKIYQTRRTTAGDKVTASPFHWKEGISSAEDDLVPRSSDELRSKKSELQIYKEKSFDKDSGALKMGAGDQLRRGIRKENGANRKQYIYSRLNDLNGGSKVLEEPPNHTGIRENGKSLKSSKQKFQVHDYLSSTEKSSAWLLMKPESMKEANYHEANVFASDKGNEYFTYLNPTKSSEIQTSPIGSGNKMSIKSKEVKTTRKYKSMFIKRNASNVVMLKGTNYSWNKFYRPDMSISSLSNRVAVDSRYSFINSLIESVLTRHKRQFEKTPQINSDIKNGNTDILNPNSDREEAFVIVIDRTAQPVAGYFKKNDQPRGNSEQYNSGLNSGKLLSVPENNHQLNQSKDNFEVVTSRTLEYRDNPRYLNVYSISSFAGAPQKTSSRQTGLTPHAFVNRRQNVDNRWKILGPASSPVRIQEFPSPPIAPHEHAGIHVVVGRPRSKLKSWFETRVLRGNSRNLHDANGNGPSQIWYIILPIERGRDQSVSANKRSTLQPKNDEPQRPALPQRESEDDDLENTTGDVIRTRTYFHPKERPVQFTPRGVKRNKPNLRQYERYVEGEQFELSNETDRRGFLDWFNSQWGFITISPTSDAMTTNDPNNATTMKQPDNHLTTDHSDAKHTRGYPKTINTTSYPNNILTTEYPNNMPTTKYPNSKRMTKQPTRQNTIQYPDEQHTTVQANDMSSTKLTGQKYTTEHPYILLSTLFPSNHREPKGLNKPQTTTNPSTQSTTTARLPSTTKSSVGTSSTTKSSMRTSSTTKSPKRPSSTTTKSPKRPSSTTTTKSPKRPSSTTTKSPKRPSSTTTKSPKRPSSSTTTKSPKRPSSTTTTKSPKKPTSATMQPFTKTVITMHPIGVNVTSQPEKIINKPTTHDPWWIPSNKKVWKKPVPCGKGFVPSYPWKIWHKTTTTMNRMFGGD